LLPGWRLEQGGGAADGGKKVDVFTKGFSSLVQMGKVFFRVEQEKQMGKEHQGQTA